MILTKQNHSSVKNMPGSTGVQSPGIQFIDHKDYISFIGPDKFPGQQMGFTQYDYEFNYTLPTFNMLTTYYRITSTMHLEVGYEQYNGDYTYYL